MRAQWLIAVIVVWAASLWAAPGPEISVDGAVTINGGRIFRTTALFSGDRIETGRNSSATIQENGSEVVLFANSSLAYSADGVNLSCGAMMVATTEKRVTMRIDNLVITPISGVAEFEISQTGGRLQIASRAGTISVDDGSKSAALDVGKTLSFRTSGTCPESDTTRRIAAHR